MLLLLLLLTELVHMVLLVMGTMMTVRADKSKVKVEQRSRKMSRFALNNLAWDELITPFELTFANLEKFGSRECLSNMPGHMQLRHSSFNGSYDDSLKIGVSRLLSRFAKPELSADLVLVRD
jgi:hypothetical protein